MQPPITIEIKSDNNILTFVEFKNNLYLYKYTRSLTKKGNSLYLTETELKKLLEHNKIINPL